MKKIFKKFFLLFLGFVFINLFVQTNVFGLPETKEKIQDVKISIIIPIYNTEKYLDECLSSAENQTYKNLEIVCVNDGSTDDSLKILKEHAKKDSRIVIVNQKNQGESVARNTGIRTATGKYIYFLDSDDVLLPHVMEKSVNLLEKHNADVLEFKFVRYRCDQKVDFSKFKYDDSQVKISTYKKGDNPFKVFNGTIKVWDKVYKRSFLIENAIWFNKDIKISQDVLFNFIVRFYIKKMVRDYNTGYIYRIRRPGSAVAIFSVNQKFHIENHLKVIKEMISFRDKLNVESKDIDSYFASYMINLVCNRIQHVDIKNVKDPTDKQKLAKMVCTQLCDNFVEKYNVRLSAKDQKKLDDLKELAKR